MEQQNETSTRDKIMRAAARMFSEKGFERVTTREIAKAIGINSATIYYYFPSKDELLKSLYEFYTTERRKEYPDIDELLRLAETDPPHEVLMKTEFHYNEDIMEYLDQILVTAVRRIVVDPESEGFIRENIFDSIRNILQPLLTRLVELGKIEPFDINVFLNILSYYCFAAAALNNSSYGQSVAQYQAAMSCIYSMIVPIEGKDSQGIVG
ncbi:MAG: TetR/AcrR family transcriptional regulator [Eggerthellaceae bacterium]|nr:TetR/AcrR family transcriptional regulator [Eggerthellaceae bacterium]